MENSFLPIHLERLKELLFYGEVIHENGNPLAHSKHLYHVLNIFREKNWQFGGFFTTSSPKVHKAQHYYTKHSAEAFWCIATANVNTNDS